MISSNTTSVNLSHSSGKRFVPYILVKRLSRISLMILLNTLTIREYFDLQEHRMNKNNAPMPKSPEIL